MSNNLIETLIVVLTQAKQNLEKERNVAQSIQELLHLEKRKGEDCLNQLNQHKKKVHLLEEQLKQEKSQSHLKNQKYQENEQKWRHDKSELEEELSKGNIQCHVFQKKQALLQEEKVKAEDSCKQLERARVDLENQLINEKNQVLLQQGHLLKQKEQIDELTHEIKQYYLSFDQIKQKKQQWVEQHKTMQHSLSDSQKKVTQTTTQVKDYQLRLLQLSQELDCAKKEKMQMGNQIVQLEEDIRDIQKSFTWEASHQDRGTRPLSEHREVFTELLNYKESEILRLQKELASCSPEHPNRPQQEEFMNVIIRQRDCLKKIQGQCESKSQHPSPTLASHLSALPPVFRQ